MSGVVTVRFTSKLHLGSRVLALLAHSEQFNHCMLLDRNMVYEAVCWHGVRHVLPEVSMHGVRIYQDMPLEVPDIAAMRAFLRANLGAGYDWPGALGLPFGRSDNWQNPDKWWCPELIIAALAAGGLHIIDFNSAKRGTPNSLFHYPAPKSPLIRL